MISPAASSAAAELAVHQIVSMPGRDSDAARLKAEIRGAGG